MVIDRRRRRRRSLWDRADAGLFMMVVKMVPALTRGICDFAYVPGGEFLGNPPHAGQTLVKPWSNPGNPGQTLVASFSRASGCVRGPCSRPVRAAWVGCGLRPCAGPCVARRARVAASINSDCRVAASQTVFSTSRFTHLLRCTVIHHEAA